MSGDHKTLGISTTPHVLSGHSVDVIMRNVVYALLPVSLYAIYVFGLAALACVLTAVITAVLSEYLLSRLLLAQPAGRASITDWSAVITGLLLALTLPPGLPLWMVACGAVIAIGIGKLLFGGLGYNAFNPALVGRAFLQAAFPVALTTWTPALQPDRFTALPGSQLAFPFTTPVYDGITAATPLALMKFEHTLTPVRDLFIGTISGSTGETSALLILAGGCWLAARNMLNWRIPVAIFATVALMSWLLGFFSQTPTPGPLFMLCSGGLMLGAVFMATDMVASPNTAGGAFFYGALIGVLVVVIRLWAGMPEGVMYAILLANAVSPHIDPWFRPRVFGTASGKGKR